VPKEFQDGTPEQADAFLEHLLHVANSEHRNFVTMLERSVQVFNRASRPNELGLDKEQFPFKIWRDQVHAAAGKSKDKSTHVKGESVRISRKQSMERYHKPSVGEIIYVTEESARSRKAGGNYAYLLNFTADDQMLVQLSGQSSPVTLSPERSRACRGAAVVVPGPVKKEARMKEKVRSDYKNEPYPAAASLLDILRATIVLDDPYALAVCAAYIQKEFDVVRLKNRFASDPVESVSVDRLLSEFYEAETVGGAVSTTQTGSEDASHHLGGSYKQQYRDVNLNIAVEFPGRETKFLCEIQLTLSPIAILKKSEQKLYSLLRMENPAELLEQYVFSRKSEGDESTVLTSHSAASVGSDGPLLIQETPQDYASALSAAGLTIGTPKNTLLQAIDGEDGGPAQDALEVIEDHGPRGRPVTVHNSVHNPASHGMGEGPPVAAELPRQLLGQFSDDAPVGTVETEGIARSTPFSFGLCNCSDSNVVPCTTARN
jgi:hypothetical protein